MTETVEIPGEVPAEDLEELELRAAELEEREGARPDVRFITTTPDKALDHADDLVDDLLDDWRPQDVALLTAGSRHPEQVARQADGQDAYWRSFWDDDQVFYATFSGSRAWNDASWCWR